MQLSVRLSVRASLDRLNTTVILKDSCAKGWIGQWFKHESDHCEAHESGDGSGTALEIARQPAISADRGEGPFNDPAF